MQDLNLIFDTHQKCRLSTRDSLTLALKGRMYDRAKETGRRDLRGDPNSTASSGILRERERERERERDTFTIFR